MYKNIKSIHRKEALLEICQNNNMKIDESLLNRLQKVDNRGKKMKKYYNACKIVEYLFHKELVKRTNKNDPQVIQFLKTRRITFNTIAKYQLGYAPNVPNFLAVKLSDIEDEEQIRQTLIELGYLKNHDTDFFVNRFIFPIQNSTGQTVGFGGRSLNEKNHPKYLNSPESVLFHKKDLLFNFNHAKVINFSAESPKKIYLVEGYMDVLTMSEHGMKNVVATMGTGLSKQQIDLLKSNFDAIVFAFDTDRAGQIATVHNAREVLKTNFFDSVNVAQIKNRFKDIDEQIRHEPSTLQEKSYFDWYYGFLQKQYPENESYASNKFVKEVVNFAPSIAAHKIINDCLHLNGFWSEDLENFFNKETYFKNKNLAKELAIKKEEEANKIEPVNYDFAERVYIPDLAIKGFVFKKTTFLDKNDKSFVQLKIRVPNFFINTSTKEGQAAFISVSSTSEDINKYMEKDVNENDLVKVKGNVGFVINDEKQTFMNLYAKKIIAFSQKIKKEKRSW